MTPEERAFITWFNAYSKNYFGTGLMELPAILKQCWLAATNYERQDCAKIAEEATEYKFGMDPGTSEWIAQAIRARSGK